MYPVNAGPLYWMILDQYLGHASSRGLARHDQKYTDGRMSYIEDMHEIVNIVTEWITSRGTILVFLLLSLLKDVYRLR